MGKSAKGMFALASVETMAQSIELVLADTRRLGPDLRLTYQVE